MRAVWIALVVALMSIFASAHVYEEGEINCIGANDEGRKYRDINDATRYWMCPVGQDYGVKETCPPETAFLQAEQKCVSWGSWYWKQPYTE